MFQIMAYDTPHIEKSPTKTVISVSPYVLAEVIVEGIYYNSIQPWLILLPNK